MECCIEILGLGTGMAEADVEDADDDECVEGESCGRKQIYETLKIYCLIQLFDSTKLSIHLCRKYFKSSTFGVVGVLLSETGPLLSPPGRSRTRSGVCLFLCSLEGSDAVDGLGL